MAIKPLTDRDLETLRDLLHVCDDRAKQMESASNPRPHDFFVKPMDIGGMDCSHHSKTLKKLVRRGLADIWEPSLKHPGRSRYGGGCLYKINDRGRAAMKAKGEVVG